MKWFAALMLLGASVAYADVQLEWVEKTVPVYPVELRKAAITGVVRVGFEVNFDGSISNVRVIQSSDPAFVDVTLDAVRQWRFKPWKVSSDNPAKIEVTNVLKFRLSDKREWWDLYERAGLVVMTCKQFNDEVALFRNKDSARSLDTMKTTRLSIRLTSQFSNDGATSYQQSQADAASFKKALPAILKRCQAYPGLDFVDVWPQQLRERLQERLAQKQ